VLARTSSSVVVVHRRDSFRASHILAQRLIASPKITVVYDTVVTRFEGDGAPGDDERLRSVELKNVKTGATSALKVAAAFVAIGHDPNTKIFQGALDMNDQGYLLTEEGSTCTSMDGIFAAGDVADHVYRQAVTSAGTGAMAALDAERWLSERGVGAG
jgi:thioredoxin reductase (NADPH)